MIYRMVLKTEPFTPNYIYKCLKVQRAVCDGSLRKQTYQSYIDEFCRHPDKRNCTEIQIPP